MSAGRSVPDDSGVARKSSETKRHRTLPSVEAEIEWSKVARRFKRVDSRALKLLRDAYLEGYLRARR